MFCMVRITLLGPGFKFKNSYTIMEARDKKDLKVHSNLSQRVARRRKSFLVEEELK